MEPMTATQWFLVLLYFIGFFVLIYFSINITKQYRNDPLSTDTPGIRLSKRGKKQRYKKP